MRREKGTPDTVQVRLEGGNWVNATGTYSWSLTPDVSKSGKGYINIYARALDGTFESDTVSVKVSTGGQEPTTNRGGFPSCPAAAGVSLACIVAMMLAARLRRVGK